MVEEPAQEEWAQTLTERPLDREDQSWDVQTVGEKRFTLLALAVAADTDLSAAVAANEAVLCTGLAE